MACAEGSSWQNLSLFSVLVIVLETFHMHAFIPVPVCSHLLTYTHRRSLTYLRVGFKAGSTLQRRGDKVNPKIHVFITYSPELVFVWCSPWII